MVNMPPSQLFETCSNLPASNLKWAHFEQNILQFISLNIFYILYVVLWIKYWLMWFVILLVFILFKF